MKADHVNSFIGATQGVEPMVVMAYCEKGSLRDIMECDDIKLDAMFILSFLSDVARVCHKILILLLLGLLTKEINT